MNGPNWVLGDGNPEITVCSTKKNCLDYQKGSNRVMVLDQMEDEVDKKSDYLVRRE